MISLNVRADNAAAIRTYEKLGFAHATDYVEVMLTARSHEREAVVICVVGGGAAGLACAAMLRRAGAEVVVLERDDVGAAWQARYDCLHLHTVRWLSGLPGYGIPRSYGKWPSRDHVVEYLRAYAARMRSPFEPA